MRRDSPAISALLQQSDANDADIKRFLTSCSSAASDSCNACATHDEVALVSPQASIPYEHLESTLRSRLQGLLDTRPETTDSSSLPDVLRAGTGTLTLPHLQAAQNLFCSDPQEASITNGKLDQSVAEKYITNGKLDQSVAEKCGTLEKEAIDQRASLKVLWDLMHLRFQALSELQGTHDKNLREFQAMNIQNLSNHEETTASCIAGLLQRVEQTEKSSLEVSVQEYAQAEDQLRTQARTLQWLEGQVELRHSDAESKVQMAECQTLSLAQKLEQLEKRLEQQRVDVEAIAFDAELRGDPDEMQECMKTIRDFGRRLEQQCTDLQAFEFDAELKLHKDALYVESKRQNETYTFVQRVEAAEAQAQELVRNSEDALTQKIADLSSHASKTELRSELALSTFQGHLDESLTKYRADMLAKVEASMQGAAVVVVESNQLMKDAQARQQDQVELLKQHLQESEVMSPSLRQQLETKLRPSPPVSPNFGNFGSSKVKESIGSSATYGLSAAAHQYGLSASHRHTVATLKQAANVTDLFAQSNQRKNVEDLDKRWADFWTEISESQGSMTGLQEQIQQHDKACEDLYRAVGGLENDVSALTELPKAVSNLESKLSEITALPKAFSQLENEVTAFADLFEGIGELKSKLIDVADISGAVGTLESQVNLLTELPQVVDNLERKISAISDFLKPFSKFTVSVSALEDKVTAIVDLSESVATLESKMAEQTGRCKMLQQQVTMVKDMLDTHEDVKVDSHKLASRDELTKMDTRISDINVDLYDKLARTDSAIQRLSSCQYLEGSFADLRSYVEGRLASFELDIQTKAASLHDNFNLLHARLEKEVNTFQDANKEMHEKTQDRMHVAYQKVASMEKRLENDSALPASEKVKLAQTLRGTVEAEVERLLGHSLTTRISMLRQEVLEQVKVDMASPSKRASVSRVSCGAEQLKQDMAALQGQMKSIGGDSKENLEHIAKGFGEKHEILQEMCNRLQSSIEALDEEFQSRISTLESSCEVCHRNIGEMQANNDTTRVLLGGVQGHELGDVHSRLRLLEESALKVPAVLRSEIQAECEQQAKLHSEIRSKNAGDFLEAQDRLEGIVEEVKRDFAVKSAESEARAEEIKTMFKSEVEKLEACGIYDTASRFTAVSNQLNAFALDLDDCKEGLTYLLDPTQAPRE